MCVLSFFSFIFFLIYLNSMSFRHLGARHMNTVNVLVSTFEGRERHVIIFDFVTGSPCRKTVGEAVEGSHIRK